MQPTVRSLSGSRCSCFQPMNGSFAPTFRRNHSNCKRECNGGDLQREVAKVLQSRQHHNINGDAIGRSSPGNVSLQRFDAFSTGLPGRGSLLARRHRIRSCGHPRSCTTNPSGLPRRIRKRPGERSACTRPTSGRSTDDHDRHHRQRVAADIGEPVSAVVRASIL
jgi:hypothetical protein